VAVWKSVPNLNFYCSNNINTQSIPITVKAGSATFKADLRLRVQCGAEAEIDLIGIGAGAVVGIYANLIEFVAVLESTPTCALQTTEWFDLNVGAYARLNVVVDLKTIGPVPTVSTTLLNSPTFTQCWLEHSPGETGVAYTTTATTALSPSSPLSLVFGTLSVPGAGQPEPSKTALTTVLLPTGTGITTASGSQASTVKFPIGNGTMFDSEQPVTSTLYSTTMYTITSCAASVVNCPASWEKEIVVTQTVDSFTTVCPPGADVAFPSSSKTVEAAAAPTLPAGATPNAATVHVITEVIVLTPCSTPIVETFVPPTTPLPHAQHEVVVLLPAPTTSSLAVAIKYYGGSNSTIAHPTGAKHSGGLGSTAGVGTTVRPTAFTAGAGPSDPIPSHGHVIVAVGLILGAMFLL
jgi:hypothetical protein